MGGIKRTKHDAVFSNYIRERDKWSCQRCGRSYNKYSPNARRALHCSHYIGRGNWSVRFEPNNAVALCYGCHRLFGADPHAHTEFIKKRLNQDEYESLITRKNTMIKKRDLQSKEFYEQLKLMLYEAQEDCL